MGHKTSWLHCEEVSNVHCNQLMPNSELARYHSIKISNNHFALLVVVVYQLPVHCSHSVAIRLILDATIMLSLSLNTNGLYHLSQVNEIRKIFTFIFTEKEINSNSHLR